MSVREDAVRNNGNRPVVRGEKAKAEENARDIIRKEQRNSTIGQL
jgi:hypothetical protein